VPGGYRRLAQFLQVYEARHCGRPVPTISSTPPVTPPTAPGLPVPVPTAVPPAVSGITPALLDQIISFVLPASGVPAPPCQLQDKFNTSGEFTRYPHVKAK
jgi:hypothetical protein